MDYYYKKSGSIFNAHSYWTKQPVDVIQEFIRHNTLEGDTVLDPFCGSGMTGVACIKSNRRFLLSDISPICLHIAKGYSSKKPPVDINELFESLTENIKPLYSIVCPECGTICQIDYSILEDKLEAQGVLEMQHAVFHCTKCKKKFKQIPSAEDQDKQNASLFLNHYYPQDYFFGEEPKRNYKRGVRQVYQLYSKRNLSALSMLLDNIKSLKDDASRQFALFAFTSLLFNCSIMSRYNPKYENTQIKMGTYYIPQFIKDNNVVLSFERKLRAIVASQNEVYSSDYTYDGSVCYRDATNLADIPDNSIDYIYTDPPYSDKISYSELNIVYESWLGNGCTNTENEMIVTKDGSKDIQAYSDMFGKFLGEAYRVLKPGKRITIIFHNSSLEHWMYFQNVLASSAFVPLNNSEVERILSSSKTSTQYQSENDSQCFLAFTLVKDKNIGRPTILTLSKEDYLQIIAKYREDAVAAGFTKKCDQFDYIINKLLFSYTILPEIKI